MSETPKRPNRWLYPLLFLSLAGNLLIVGVVVGWMASPNGKQRSDFGPARGLVGEPFVRALPTDQRRALMRDVLKEAPQIRESRDSLKARFEAFLTAIRAEPFDPERVAELMAEQRDVAVKRQDIGQRFLLERFTAMSQQERNDYADALEDALKRPKRKQN